MDTVTHQPCTEDESIIALYFARDERAIRETDRRYGRLCLKVSHNILGDRLDAEECVNDAYLRAWDTIPPKRPSSLCLYICRIVRNLSISRLRANTALRRNRDLTVSLSELEDCLPAAEEGNAEALRELLSTFLRTEVDETDRRLFLARYWYATPVKQLAEDGGMTPNAVSLRLYKTREKLRAYLLERGYSI